MVKLPDMSDEESGEAKSVAAKPSLGINQHFLDCFWKLAEPKEEVRLEASLALIKHLVKNKTVSVKELDYALARLVKGLSSSRANARQGFFTALTALLKTLPSDVLSNSKYGEVVRKNLVPKGDKTEKNDIYAGLILAYGAFIKSRRIPNLQDADTPILREMLEGLVVASKQKNYLHSLAFGIIGELLQAECPETFVETQIWPVLEPEVAVRWEEQTPDTLWVLLLITGKYPSLLKPKQLKDLMGCKRLTDETCFSSLADTLAKQLPSSDNTKLHQELITRLAKKGMVAKFWENALIPLANDNKVKGAVVLSLLKFALLAVQDKSEIPTLFPDVVVRIIMSVARKEETSLLELVLACLDVLKDRLSDEEVSAETQIHVLNRLTQPPASIAFDRLTGTNILAELTAVLKVEAVRHLATLYRTCVENAEAKTQDRVYSVYHLAKLVSHPSVQSEVDWKAEQLQFLLKCAIQGKTKNANGVWTFPRDLGSALLEGVYKALDNPCKKLSDLVKLLFQVVTFCDLLLEDYSRVLPEGKALKAWKAMLSQVTLLRAAGLKKSQKSQQSEDWVNQIFQVLFLHMGLQLIREPEMASEVLEELQLCYQKASHKPKKAAATRKSKNKAIDEEESGAEEPHWLEVVTDILLSLLSQSRHLLRSLVLSVWTIILPHLTPAALQQILDVIDPTKQEKPLVNAAEDESESEESEDGDAEERAEEEESGETMEGEDEEDVEDEEMDVEEDDEETVTDKLRLDIRAALGDAAAMTDNESVDVDDMSESEMQRVDQALEAAFRQYRVARPAPLTAKQRSKQPKDDTTLMHFRLRCLDLLDNLLGQDTPLALVMMLPEPLLACLEFTTKDGRQKPLEEKLRTLVRKLANVRKFASVGDITMSGLEELLEILLQKPYQVPTLMPQLGDDLALCATLVVRGALYVVKDHDDTSQTSHKSDKKKKQSSSSTEPPTLLPKMLSLYTAAVEKYFAKRDSPLPFALFSRVLQMSWSDAWQLGTALIKPAFNMQVPPFRRIQALQLLTALFRNHTALEAAGPSTLGELVQNILSEASKVLMSTTSESFKPKYFAELFSFLRVVYQTLGSGNITAALDEEKVWNEIKQAILLFRDNGAVKQQPDMKRAIRRLALVLRLNLNIPSRGTKRGSENDAPHEQQTTKKKSKTDNDGKVAAALNTNEDNSGTKEAKEGDDDQATEPKDTDDEPAKKKKKKKSSGKDRKEAKALRLASLSEGMEQVRFVGGALQEPTEESEEPQVVEAAPVSPKKTLKKIKAKKSSTN